MTRLNISWQFALFALVASFAAVMLFNAAPIQTDSYYHYNAAVRVAQGDGFVDDYLWVYIGEPDTLPAPSHLYWMPGTTLVSLPGMLLLGAQYRGAQIGLALCLWGAVLLTYWLGVRMGGSRRYGWQAALITLTGGFFLRWWGQTDTFAPYAFFGALALLFMGLGLAAERHQGRYWLLAGVMAAAGHLIRNDGLLLLLVGWCVLLWPPDLLRGKFGRHLRWLLMFTGAYLLAMLPWFLRNLEAFGAILPVGGTQAIWFTEYNDLFNYPPRATMQTFFADGFQLLVQSRLNGLLGGGGALVNFLVVEGYIVFAPLIVIALLKRGRDPFWRGVWIFAVGIHLAFALVFPFPGERGGIFHAVVALVPFWSVLILLGLDDLIDWLAARYKRWGRRKELARVLYSNGIVLLVVGLSLAIVAMNNVPVTMPAAYAALQATVEEDARIMSADPAGLYYFTGLGGVVLPNESPDVLPIIAARYDIDYLLLQPPNIPTPLQFDVVPDFLTPIEMDGEDVELYAIERDET